MISLWTRLLKSTPSDRVGSAKRRTAPPLGVEALERREVLSGTVGSGTGLLGEYFADTSLNKLVATRVDPTVNFTWQRDTAPLPGMPADNWSVRWHGKVEAMTTEAYQFTTVSDDGVRLFVNGHMVVNHWNQHSATADSSSPIQLVAGQTYSIEMDYFEARGEATAGLAWSSPSIRQEIIPSTQLYSQTVPTPAPVVTKPAAASSSQVSGTSVGLTVLGAEGGTDTGLTYSWAVAGPAGVTFSANGTNAAKSTTATFAAAGAYTFTATVKDASGRSATSTVGVSVDQTLSGLTISPATVSLGDAATQPFAAAGKDQFGHPIASPPAVSWTLDVGSVGALDPKTGLYTAPASGSGAAGVTATATGTQLAAHASVRVIARAPTVVTPAAASSAQVGGTSVGLSVFAGDVTGESTLTYTWAVTGPAGVTFSANGTNAAKSATATFAAAGAYTFTVTATDPSGLSVTSSVPVTVTQTLTALSLSPASVTLGNAVTQPFTVSGTDQFGAPLTGQIPVSWSLAAQSVGAIDPNTGVYTSPATGPGNAVVVATVPVNGGQLVKNAVVFIQSQPPTIVVPPAASSSQIGGTTVGLSVLGGDVTGESNLSYRWSVSGPSPVSFSADGTNAAKSTTATFTAAGSYTFTVTVTNLSGLTATDSRLTVVVTQTLTTLTVAPGSVTLSPGATQSFTAAGTDQFGRPISSPAVSWSLGAGDAGAIDPASGLYTAPGSSGGSATVHASGGAATASAAVTVIAAAPDWFSQNITDSGLRTLARADFQRDGQITRADLIGLFRQAETESGAGTVSAPLFNDLKTIVGNAATLKLADYVQNLGSKLVNGDPANATFQGAALGNLSTATTSAQLEELVGKWFLGTDLPNARDANTGANGTYTLDAAGALFTPAGPAYTDVAQGQVGDCYFVSSLAEVALKSPATIQNMFIDNGDGTFTVRFYQFGAYGGGDRSAQYVTVDRHLTGSYAHWSSSSAWVALAEKAYAELASSGWSRGSGQANAYSSLDGGWMYYVLEQVTGKAADHVWDIYPSTTTEAAFQSAYNAGDLITLGSNSSGTTNGIISSHAYAMISYNAATQMYTLYNPWGYTNTLTWAQIVANFDAVQSTPHAAQGVVDGVAAVIPAQGTSPAARPAGTSTPSKPAERSPAGGVLSIDHRVDRAGDAVPSARSVETPDNGYGWTLSAFELLDAGAGLGHR